LVAQIVRIAGKFRPLPTVLLICLLVFAMSKSAVAASFDDSIDTNRPSFMFSPIVLPKGSVQLENGLLYQGLRRNRTAFDLPETQVRLGLGHTTEFQIFVPNYVINKTNDSRMYGATDLAEIGLKQQLRRNPGRFNAALIADLTVPTGTKRLSAGGTQAAFRLPYGYALTDKWSICGMQSVLIINKGKTVQWQPDALICRTLGAKSSVFMEYGGFFTPHQRAINILHFGGVYKLTKLQQVDGQFGFGLNDAAPSAFVGCGYSCRFDGLF